MVVRPLSLFDCLHIYFRKQMTAQEARLCGLLLREHFGEVVEKIGTHLLRSGAQNLRTIVNESGTPIDLVCCHIINL